MKYKAIIETNKFKGFKFFEDGIGKYMVGKDAGATCDSGWIPLYFTEVKEETVTEFADRCRECGKQKTAYWIDGHCSNCGCDIPAYVIDYKWQKDMDAKYCPNCGRRMVKP